MAGSSRKQDEGEHKSLVIPAINIGDFDLPGQVTSRSFDRLDDVLRDWARRKDVDPASLLDHICIFYAMHGTSSVLTVDLGFSMPALRGEQKVFISAGEATNVLRSAAPGFTLRQIMRAYANRTRDLLRQLPVTPLFVRKYLHPHRESGFDFADGCTDPPFPVDILSRLRRYREFSFDADTPRYDMSYQ